MADECDITGEREAAMQADLERKRELEGPVKFEEGVSGDCERCGEPCARLVMREGQLSCARCRDKFHLG